MADVDAAARTDRTWPAPSTGIGVVAGIVVVLAFAVVHDVLITDIWFNVGPMLTAGGLIGLTIVWSYGSVVADHTTRAWFRYNAIYAVEMILLGLVSVLVLKPRFTMAELLVDEDAFERLLPPSMPMIIGATVVGTVVVWLLYRRPPGSILPILLTQVLVVFFLGHQFAFIGLVEPSSTLFRAYVEFSVYAVGLALAFAAVVRWSSAAMSAGR